MKEDIGLFDAPFFSMTAAEAEGMDPQHRILLEVTYEAFENGKLGGPLHRGVMDTELIFFLAGMPLKTVAGSQTAVYVNAQAIWFIHDFATNRDKTGWSVASPKTTRSPPDGRAHTCLRTHRQVVAGQ